MTRWLVLSCLLCLVPPACTPALDWREVRPPDSGAVLLMPCKPSGQTRRVLLAGKPVVMALHACSANGQTWGLSFADVDDPARLGEAIEALRSAAAANIGASAPGQPTPLAVPGATPHPSSGSLRLSGRQPSGEALQMQLALFAHGSRVFQATVLGPNRVDDEAEAFFFSIRFGP